MTHEWVEKTFSQCGDVAYVSLPRYHTTGDLKGFGFVEFVTEEGADKACKVFIYVSFCRAITQLGTLRALLNLSQKRVLIKLVRYLFMYQSAAPFHN